MKLPANPVIETARLRMRIVEKGDLPALMGAHGHSEAVRYIPYEPWKTLADAEAWYKKAEGRIAAGEALQFVITEKDGARVVGTMVLFNFNEGAKCAEIGYLLAPETWSRGYMKEAIPAVVRFAFGTLGLERLDAKIDPRNAASGVVLERAGFKKEGHQRKNYFAKGEVSDTGLYGLLKEDAK